MNYSSSSPTTTTTSSDLEQGLLSSVSTVASATITNNHHHHQTTNNESEEYLIINKSSSNAIIITATSNNSNTTTTTLNHQKPAFHQTRWFKTILSLLTLLILVFLSFISYLASQGAFKPISHAPPQRVNDSFVEPNTHFSFPIKIPGMSSNTPVQELIGVDLWSLSYASAHYRIAAVALYIGATPKDKSILKPFVQEAGKLNDDLKNVLTNEGLLQTLHFKIATSFPSSIDFYKLVCHDDDSYFERYCQNKQVIEEQKKMYYDFFKPLHFDKGFDFSYERHETTPTNPEEDGLYISIGPISSNTIPIKKKLPLNSCFIKAIWRQKLDQIGNGLTRFMDNLFQ
jgi:hypothetical protein